MDELLEQRIRYKNRIAELEAVVTTLHNQALSAREYYTTKGQHINRQPRLNLAGAIEILRLTTPILGDATLDTGG